jgi:hypothetical protein
LISEYLRNSTPTDVFYEDALLIFGRFAIFRIESVRKLDGRKVVPTLLFQRAAAECILSADAIIVRV